VRLDQKFTIDGLFQFLIIALACLLGIWSGQVQASSEVNKEDLLSGPLITEIVKGKRIYIEVPFGGEMPLYYRADGYVDGSGEAVGLGRYLAPTDSGRWWVEENRLCQQWKTWYDGRVFCFTLQTLANDQLYWRRDDGEEGKARISD
jgi:hypothetical protein